MAGPLASLLMGVGERAAEVSRRNEQRAYNEQLAGKQLASESIMEMLKDPTRTYEDQRRLAGQLEDIHGMKKGSLQSVFDQAQQLHPHIERAISQAQGQQPMPPIPEMKAGPTYSVPSTGTMTAEPPVTIRGGALAGQQAPAVTQPNVQMQSAPQIQQLAPMPQPPVGLNPQGQAGQQPTLGHPDFVPQNEMERKQHAVAQSVRQHMEDLKSLNLPPDVLNDAIRAGVGIPPSVQAAQVGATSKENVAMINAKAKVLASGNNSGHFVTVQEPGSTIPKTVFQIDKGKQAGMMVEPNTMEPTQLEPGFKKLYDHPDKLSLTTDKDGNVSVVNETQGKVTANLGPIGTPKTTAANKPIAVKYQGDDGQNYVQYMTPEEAMAKGQFRAPEAAMTQNRKVAAENSIRMSKELSDYLDKPEVKKVMGPWAGRVSSWENFIGNPPPEFAELRGMFMSWTELQPALHGMRSAEMAKEIEKAVGPQVTPEALKAFIKGFNRTAQVVATSGTLYPSNEELGGAPSLKKPPPPPAGTVIDGYRYNGKGNVPSNWEKVK